MKDRIQIVANSPNLPLTARFVSNYLHYKRSAQLFLELLFFPPKV